MVKSISCSEFWQGIRQSHDPNGDPGMDETLAFHIDHCSSCCEEFNSYDEREFEEFLKILGKGSIEEGRKVYNASAHKHRNDLLH